MNEVGKEIVWLLCPFSMMSDAFAVEYDPKKALFSCSA